MKSFSWKFRHKLCFQASLQVGCTCCVSWHEFSFFSFLTRCCGKCIFHVYRHEMFDWDHFSESFVSSSTNYVESKINPEKHKSLSAVASLFFHACRAGDESWSDTFITLLSFSYFLTSTQEESRHSYRRVYVYGTTFHDVAEMKRKILPWIEKSEKNFSSQTSKLGEKFSFFSFSLPNRENFKERKTFFKQILFNDLDWQSNFSIITKVMKTGSSLTWCKQIIIINLTAMFDTKCSECEIRKINWKILKTQSVMKWTGNQINKPSTSGIAFRFKQFQLTHWDSKWKWIREGRELSVFVLFYESLSFEALS